jgi:hypothetical protein
VRLVRNLEQARSGGQDLILATPEPTDPVAAQIARYAFEVKRGAKVAPALLRRWWAQACSQAEALGRVPLLAYRPDHWKWRLVLPLAELRPELPAWEGLDWMAELSLPGFCAWIREAA